MREIAETHGISIAVVLGALKRLNVERRHPGGASGRRWALTDAQRDEALALYQSGKSAEDVAQSLGVSKGTVLRIAAEAGATRPTNEQAASERLGSDVIREIAKRYQAGEPLKALAREHGMSRTTLQRRMSALGLR